MTGVREYVDEQLQEIGHLLDESIRKSERSTMQDVKQSITLSERLAVEDLKHVEQSILEKLSVSERLLKQDVSKCQQDVKQIEYQAEKHALDLGGSLDNRNKAIGSQLTAFRKDLLDEVEGLTSGFIDDKLKMLKAEETKHTKALSRLVENRHNLITQELKVLKTEIAAMVRRL